MTRLRFTKSKSSDNFCSSYTMSNCKLKVLLRSTAGGDYLSLIFIKS